MAVPTIVQLPLFPIDKWCSRCKAALPLDAFGYRQNSRDGRRCWCKTCECLVSRAYVAQHRDEINARERAKTAADPAWKRAKHERWYAKHRDDALVTKRRWYAANKETQRAKSLAYHYQHRERITAYMKQWRKDNPLLVHLGTTARRLRQRKAPGRYTLADLSAIAAEQGMLCYYCHQPMERPSVEHKQPLARGGTNWPENIALTHWTCNRSKHAKTEAEYRVFLAQKQPH